MHKRILHFSAYIVLVLVVAVFALNNSASEEQSVYLGLAHYFKQETNTSESAVYSYPSDCAAEGHSLTFSDALWKSFHSANSTDSGPTRLFSLEGVINVVDWDDNLQLYDTKGLSARFRPTDKSLVKFSRVGFNNDKTEALICVESNNNGVLFYLKKDPDSWKVVRSLNVWVS